MSLRLEEERQTRQTRTSRRSFKPLTLLQILLLRACQDFWRIRKYKRKQTVGSGYNDEATVSRCSVLKEQTHPPFMVGVVPFMVGIGPEVGSFDGLFSGFCLLAFERLPRLEDLVLLLSPQSFFFFFFFLHLVDLEPLLSKRFLRPRP